MPNSGYGEQWLSNAIVLRRFQPVFGIVLLVINVIVLLGAYESWQAGHQKSAIALLLWALYAMYMAISTIKSRVGPLCHAIIASLSVAFFVTILLDDASVMSPGSRWLLCVAVVLTSVIVGGTWINHFLNVAAIASAVLAGVLLEGWPVTLANSYGIIGGTWAAVVIVRLAVRAIYRGQKLLAEENRRLVKVGALDAKQQAEDAYRRLLHDELSSHLRALATDQGDAQTRADAARSAIQVLESEQALGLDGAQTNLDEYFHSALLRPERAQYSGPQHQILVPARVARAAGAATNEAIRNAIRHSQATQIRVELTARGEGFVVSIKDNGVGFEVEKPMKRSFGIKNSIVAPVREVGGWAQISSRPTKGTVVQIGYNDKTRGDDPQRKSTIARMQMFVGDFRGAAVIAVAPYCVLHLLMVGLELRDEPQMWPIMIWLAGLLAMCIYLLMGLQPELSNRISIVFYAYAAAGGLAAIPLMPDNAVSGFHSWPIGSIGVFFAVMVAIRPLPEVVIMFTAERLLMFIACAVFGSHLLPPETGPLMFLPAILSAFPGIIAGIVLRLMVGRLSGQLLDLQEELLQQTLTTLARDEEVQLRSRRVASVLNNIGKHLRVWSNPGYDFTEKDAELARICNLAVRDELHIPLVLDRETGLVIWNTRLRGCQVVFQSTGNVDIPAAPFCQFIQETFPLLPPGSDITVTISAVGELRVMVNLVAQVGLDPEAETSEDGQLVAQELRAAQVNSSWTDSAPPSVEHIDGVVLVGITLDREPALT